MRSIMLTTLRTLSEHGCLIPENPDKPCDTR
jgi:hypothetical protein